MVSGLVTSPWDHERIFSGLAKLMRMESKSAIRLARSYGLLRYKVVPPCPSCARALPAETGRETRQTKNCGSGASLAYSEGCSGYGFCRVISSTSKHND